ncbi:MAG: rhamnulokinase, partial [Clostridia bacterium]|nr:rhamnulokinase [Clostridia bacterium]
MTYHLAIDIGASSGRHIIGWIENEILCTEEIYRFDNNIIRDGKSLVWDIDNLVYHVKNGIKRCR